MAGLHKFRHERIQEGFELFRAGGPIRVALGVLRFTDGVSTVKICSEPIIGAGVNAEVARARTLIKRNEVSCICVVMVSPITLLLDLNKSNCVIPTRPAVNA
jgi:hypothetical protein